MAESSEWICTECGHQFQLEARFVFGYCPKCYGGQTQPMTGYVGRLREQVRVLTEALDGLLARFAVRCEEGWRCTECGVVLSGWHCSASCEVEQAYGVMQAKRERGNRLNG